MTTLPSTVTPMFVVSADPEHAAACTSLSAADRTIGLLTGTLSRWYSHSHSECAHQQSAGLRRPALAQGGTGSMLRSAAAIQTLLAFRPSGAEEGSR